MLRCIMQIPFNRSNFNQLTLDSIENALTIGHTSGDGKYTKLCNEFLKNKIGVKSSLITHSCTAALEISAILSNFEIGDEVIMPSYTFVSTANAFVLRGAKPVFVDIRDDNCNIDENLIVNAINSKTKAICVVHYAGVACDMDKVMEIAKKYNLIVIEDAAQAYNSYYKGRHLGSIGDCGCFSFHETKNVISGEGGAFVTNDEDFMDRAHIIREKGTNRTKFFNGQVDKYTWIDVGSSYLPSDIISAYLYSNLEIEKKIQEKRLDIWNSYFKAFSDFEKQGKIRLPYVNDFATNNAHMFYIRFNEKVIRDQFISHMSVSGVLTSFHYIPLHSSPAGVKFCRSNGDMSNTDKISSTLVRLPIFYDLKNLELEYIIEKAIDFLKKI